MRNKANSLSYQTWAEQSDEPLCLKLSKRDILAIYSQIEYLRYKTRWLGDLGDFNPLVYTSDLEKRLLGAMSCECNCADIAHCIETDINVYNAITNIINEQEEQLLKKLLELFNKQITPPIGSDCNDSIFACIRQTLNYMDAKNQDWLESIEASTLANAVEFTDVVASITVLDEASVDAVTSFVKWMFDNALDAYPLATTAELIDEVACEIFCTVKNTCSVKLIDIHNYFLNRVSLLMPDMSFTGFVAFTNRIANIIAGIPDRAVFDVVMLSTTTTALTIDALVGSTLKKIGGSSDLFTHMKAFSNDEDADWEILCECTDYALDVLYGTVNEASPSLISITSVPVFNSNVCNDNQGVIFATLNISKTVTSLSTSPVITADYPNRFGVYLTLPDESLLYFGYGGAPLSDAIGTVFTKISLYGECATGSNYTVEIGIE